MDTINLPATFRSSSIIFLLPAELLENNDVELFDLVNDPEENHNLAREPEKYRDLLMTMNDKLNQLTAAEIGEDDGSYMPPFEGSQWDLTAAQMHQYMRD